MRTLHASEFDPTRHPGDAGGPPELHSQDADRPAMPNDLRDALEGDAVHRLLLDLQGANIMMVDTSDEGEAPSRRTTPGPVPEVQTRFAEFRTHLGVAPTGLPLPERDKGSLPPSSPDGLRESAPPPGPAPAPQRWAPLAVSAAVALGLVAGLGATLLLVALAGLGWLVA